MNRFVALYHDVDQTTSTNAKIELMRRYFDDADPADSAWAVFFLSGSRLKRLVSYANLRRWAVQESGLPPWLFEETHATVGDLAETIALILARGGPASNDMSLTEWVEAHLLSLRAVDPDEQRRQIVSWWRSFDAATVIVLNKMLTGALRIGVSKTLVIRALAAHLDVSRDIVARGLQGDVEPTPSWFASLAHDDDDARRPIPFFLASPVDGDASDIQTQLGDRSDWIAEDKWDGIRAQAIRRGDSTQLWSRGGDDVSSAFPELTAALARLPDAIVLDGEILAHDQHGPLPFSVLQRRLGRRAPGTRIMAANPVVFMAYDLLADATGARTDDPLERRRADLESHLASLEPDGKIRLSPVIDAPTWQALAEHRQRSRDRAVEGVMLKRRGSPYRVGRVKGDWWKWKIEPHTLDLVLTYAQPGRGRRANLLTDYTFGIWEDEPGGSLVTLTKAYSGLDQKEIEELDRWIRRHTVERFGPVRRVEPEHVFKLAFEGAQWSDRHRSGVALRFPRIARWRRDLPIDQADTLSTVLAMLQRPPRDEGLLPGF